MRVCEWGSRVGRDVPDDHLTWSRLPVAGRIACYGVGGPVGPPVVFLHGWALGSRAYKRAIRSLTSRGCRVSLSVGVAVGERSEPLKGILVRADAALIEVKRRGRGRVAVAS